MRSSKTLGALITGTIILMATLAITPSRSHAAQIGIGDFGGATQTTTFDGLGLPFLNPAPLVVDGHTITTDDGLFRYFTFVGSCVANECIGNNSDLGYIDIVLDSSYERAGAFASGLFVDYTIEAEFFDASDNLLGSVILNNTIDHGALFAGWEDTTNGVARIRFTDLTNGRIEVLDNLMVEGPNPIPEPSAALLFGVGFAVVMRGLRRPRV